MNGQGEKENSDFTQEVTQITSCDSIKKVSDSVAVVSCLSYCIRGFTAGVINTDMVISFEVDWRTC